LVGRIFKFFLEWISSPKLTSSFLPHRIPNIAIEIIVAGEEETARFGEGDAGDAYTKIKLIFVNKNGKMNQPQIILSCEYMANSWSARMSKRRQVASSEPVANAWPFGKN
jgi:hypothetical protein